MSLNWVTGGGSGGGTRPASSGGEVLKTGYIKKTKTMKKKFFVLRAECGDHPSCLEYYDSEKKWKAHQPPKRVITLQSCFNINRRNDLKQRYVVALYTKDDCFGLALDSEEEAQQWLDALLETQRGEDTTEGERPKPAFEHVWQVQVQKKGLGSSRNILGSYMLCLTSHSLTLVRNGSILTQQGTPVNASASEILSDSVEFSLNTIRRCGHSDCFFYMEVGRSSVTGAGELWMQTEDTNIAQNMHDAILHAMMSCRNSSVQKADRGGDADLGPHPRARSSSANEASKPVSVLQRGSSARYGTQSTNQSQHGFNVSSPGSISAPPQSAGWRPQALPHPHPTQHSSSGLPQRLGGWVGAGAQQQQRGQQSGIHHHHHHHHHHQHHQQQQYNQQAGTTAAAISPSQRRHSVSGMGSRERCDSLPSRARTISEGPPSSSLPSSSSHHHPSPPSVAHSPSSSHPHHTHAVHSHHAHAHHHIHHLHHGPSPIINPSVGSAVIIRGAHLVPVSSSARPHSMYSRAGLSYSPPIISSPVSPASGACSTTDSAGSSLSMEEGEGWGGSNGGISAALPDSMGGDVGGGAYSTAHGLRYGHSLTPDEPAIMEENVDEEYMPWVPGGTTGLEMEEEEEEEYGGGCDAEDEGEGEEERGDVSDVDGQGGKTKRWRLRRGNGGSLKAPSGGQHPGVYVPMGVPSSRPPPAAKSSLPSPPPHASMASSPPTTLQQPTYVASTPGSLSLPLQSVVSLGGRPCQSSHAVKSQQQQVIRASASSPTSQHGAYMEMHSPCGTSSFDSVDGYMPMSPGGGGGGPLFPTAEGSCSGGGATRGSSQSTKQEDGYVPMTPGRPTDDGYVDMEPHQNKEDGGMCITGHGDMSPAASNCSVTSGTPSTDTRFSEYHLEKVSAYFTPSEEEEDGGSRGGGEGGSSTGGDDILPVGRPMRAYSVGSKPETLRRKNCLPVPNDRTNFHKSPSTSSTLEVGNMDAVRVRAFSVGSRQYLALSSANGGGSSSSPSHHHSPHRHQLHHAKAFAPSSAVGGGGSSVRSRGGALSPKGIPMATSSAHGTKKGSKSSSAPVLQTLSNSWSGSSTLCSPPGSVPSPYSQQPSGSKQGHVTHSNHNTNNPDHDLMELDFSGRGESTGGGSSRHKDEGGGGTEEESPYVPMGVPPPSGPCHQATAPLRPMATQDSTPSSFSPPPLLLSPPSGGGKAPSTASSTSSSATLEEYVDMNYSKKGEEGLPVLGSGGSATGSGDPNMGYMEMYPARKSSIAMSDNHPGDYVNMDAGSAERSRGKGSSVPEASRPIAIRKERREEGNVGGGGKEQGGGRGSSPNFSLAGLLSRKSSSGTPPKGPFMDGGGGGGSPFASLRRSQRKKRAEEDEEVDAQGREAAGDLATPTAIFPFSLNSPGSPVRPFPGQYESASKCPVDATSGTVHISYPFVPSSPVVTAGSALPGRAKGVDTLRKGEYSLSSGVNGSRGQAAERVPSQLGSAVATEGAASQFGSPEYTNCTTSPSGSCIKASDDYMPMAPLGRVRKESVVSGPMNLNAQSSLTPPSFLFSSLSPSSKLTSSPQPKGSSDYMCMKAVPAYGGSVSLTSQRTTTPMVASQRTKSSSADYMEIKLGSEPPTSPMPPTSGRNVINKNMDDYVEIDLSQKPGVIVPQASSSTSQHQQSGSRTPKAISSSVGAYVPSHTGFGFLPHIPSPSSRLPPMPSSSSYTWPRKGVQEARKATAMETASSSQGRSTMDQSKPLRDQKTDDYVQMDLGAKPSSSSVPLTEKSGGEEGNHPGSRRMSSAVRVSTPPPSTTATITATTTTLITSPRSQTKMTLVSSSSATSPPTPTSERIPITTLPPSYKFALTSSSFGSKRLLPQLSSSTTLPSSVTISTPQSTASTSAIVTTSTSSLTTTMDISKEKTPPPPSTAGAVSEVPKLEPSVSTPTMSPSSISVVSTPLTTTTPTAVSSTTCCSTSVVSSCVSSASSYCAPAASTQIPPTSPTSVSSLAMQPFVSSTCSISTSSPPSSVTTVVSVVGQSLSPTTSSSSSPPAAVVATSRGASPLAVSGPIAIPTRTSAKSQVHSLLPSGPPTHFADCTTTSAICRVVTSSGGAIERAKTSKRDEEQGSSTCAANTSTISKEKQATLPKATTVQVSSQVPCCALPASSMLRRVSSGGSVKGQELRTNVSSKAAAKDKESGPSVVAATESSVPSPGGKESPEAASVAGGRLSECHERAEGAPEALSKPSKRRGGCRRHSGDKELGMEGVRSSRPRRRSSDVSKEGSGGSKLNRTGSGRGSRGLLSDAEDKSGSYEKLLAPGTRNQQQHQRKWGTHKSLGERAPSIGWGPLRRQMSSPSAVPDPDGAYEKLLPTNGGPSRRRSGDKSGLLPVDISYTPYSPTPVFSASSSSASSSSSLASVASSILLAPITSTLKSGGSTTSSPPPPPTTTTATTTATTTTTAIAAPQQQSSPSPLGEIHYASLDLAPPTGGTANSNNNDNDNERGGRRSPRVFTRSSGAESPSGGASVALEQPLHYAEIDFSKSIASAAVKNRVRH